MVSPASSLDREPLSTAQRFGPTAGRSDEVTPPETFHVGFYLDDPMAVQTKQGELAVAGLSPGEIKDAGHTVRGTHFYCTAPGNVVIEIATPLRL